MACFHLTIGLLISYEQYSNIVQLKAHYSALYKCPMLEIEHANAQLPAKLNLGWQLGIYVQRQPVVCHLQRLLVSLCVFATNTSSPPTLFD